MTSSLLLLFDSVDVVAAAADDDDDDDDDAFIVAFDAVKDCAVAVAVAASIVALDAVKDCAVADQLVPLVGDSRADLELITEDKTRVFQTVDPAPPEGPRQRPSPNLRGGAEPPLQDFAAQEGGPGEQKCHL